MIPVRYEGGLLQLSTNSSFLEQYRISVPVPGISQLSGVKAERNLHGLECMVRLHFYHCTFKMPWQQFGLNSTQLKESDISSMIVQ